MKLRNLTGQRFGKLVVIKRSKHEGKGAKWFCKCDCGKETIVFSANLLKKHTMSCGCLKFKKGKNLKHGYSKTKLGYIYSSIKDRCFREKCKEYKFYGGRGITMCDNWKNNPLTFFNWAISNGYKEGLTIDRIDVNGNYEPSNCRWITRTEQSKNKRTNVFITYKNETHILSEWSKIAGIDYRTIKGRIKKFGMCDKVFYKGRIA